MRHTSTCGILTNKRPDETELIIISKKKIVDFAVPAACRVKLKENEKNDKYLDPARELKKLWNKKVTFIAIVIGALGTVTNGLLNGPEDLEIRGRVETMQTAYIIEIGQNIEKSH